ncbi:ferritin-like fold-containing protein [Glycomyces harbinensis]|uniref:tRNA-(MS[2]IO[6]A)-hydroxylase (MiaE)-like n=1 Tax=Glycomyces harbinensis TaxID=58114 RepID=A0A1G6UU71_9ACTN|nr:ferritin-like fold-containing protein [Glycomyces harbinensis]SDD44849.1 tRNA-(MS[2]IO[6]A)-hydroxylase (MiaE)-like [Glycomyces harbinensis]
MSETTDPAAGADDPVPVAAAPSRESVIDLLGLLALGELLAFERMVYDARLAPDLGRRAALSEAAVGEIRNYRLLADRLAELGADPAAAMAPFKEAFRSFDASTSPRDWLEALVKVYLGDAVADDFFRAVSTGLEPGDRTLIETVLAETTAADFAAEEIRAAVEADPSVTGRLSLWARRLVGEGINRAQGVAAANARLTGLIVGDGGTLDTLLRRLTRAHQDRMKSVGLNN